MDWLDAIPHPEGVDYGYAAFYSSIDTVLIGRKTYEEVMDFDVEWPYPDCNTYVITSNPDLKIKTPKTEIITDNFTQHLTILKTSKGKDIWVIGGGKLITACLNLDYIDEMTLSLIPVILGEGIPLFPDKPIETQFDLINHQTFENSVVNLTYIKNTRK